MYTLFTRLASTLTSTLLKWMETVSPDIVTLLANPRGPHSPALSRAGFVLPKFSVKYTSEAVRGLPSDHVTPCRMVKVRVCRSVLHLLDVASQGVTVLWLT